MTLHVIGATERSPIEAEIRAMVERVLAQKPLAVLVVFETADDVGYESHPPLGSVVRGLLELGGERSRTGPD